MQPTTQQTVPATNQAVTPKDGVPATPASVPTPIPAELLQQIGGGLRGPTGTW